MTTVNVILEGAPDGRVARVVAAAVMALFDRDAFLFQADVNERSITHCLGVHLAPRFPEWQVDCEYNRDGFDPKILHWSGEDEASETNGSRVYPDIIVHHRGKPENLLVIEVKKSTSSRSDEFDLSKLKLLREQLGYRHALFLRFRVEPQPRTLRRSSGYEAQPYAEPRAGAGHWLACACRGRSPRTLPDGDRTNVEHRHRRLADGSGYDLGV